MATAVQFRRGTSAQVAAFTGLLAEVVYDTTDKTLYVNDGSTEGGFALARQDFSNVANMDDVIIGATTPVAATFTTITGDTSLTLASGVTVTGIDNGSLGSSATLLATQGAIKTYVDAQVTAQDLDIITDSGTIDIDLDSESLTLAGGTGLDSSASSTTVTIAIDSTVTTLTGSQTLTNKTLTTPIISSISNTGTVTLPTATDTLVGKATTDTLTNKSISGSTNTLSAIGNSSLSNSSVSFGGVTVSLGSSSATPSFDLSSADSYPGDSSLVVSGALNSGSITSGFGNIDNGASSITGGAGSFTTISGSTSLALASGVTVTGIDNGSLGSSATLLATQGAIKTYVDATVGLVDTLAEILAIGNTTGGTDIVVTAGDQIFTQYGSSVGQETAGTGWTPDIQANGTTNGGMAITQWNAANTVAASPKLWLSKNGGGTIGTHAAVVTGENIGTIYFSGSDGTDFVNAASIHAVVGTPGANDMPGNLVFSTTADEAASVTERMRISETGAVTINTSLALATGATVTGIDNDTLGSSATLLATQGAIRTAIDAAVATADTLSEVLALGNTTGGTDIATTTTDKVQFRDAAIYINSSTDGQLDIVADTEIQIAATTIDINGAINASGEIVAASLDISGNIDVDGTTNLDVVDIDGAVDMASTLKVDGTVGFGVTPESWQSTRKALQVGDSTAVWGDVYKNSWFSNNVYRNTSGTDSYINASVAQQIYMNNGGDMFFQTAASGSADAAISWITALTIDNSGNLETSGSGGVVFNEGAADVDFRVESDTNENMLLVDGGTNRVGIGVASPSFYFTAIGDETGSQATFNSTHASYTGSALKVGAVRAANSAYNLLYLASGTAAGGTGGTAQFAVQGGGDVLFYDGAAGEGMRWDASAKALGIGTSGPAHTLVVKAAAGISPLIEVINSDTEDNDTGRESTIRFSGYRSGGEAMINAQITGSHDGSADDDDGMLTFFTNAGSGIAEKMRIDSDGKVGIAHDDPGEFDDLADRLVVGDGSGSEGITVYSGNGSDEGGNIFFADGNSGSDRSQGRIRYNQNTNEMTLSTAAAATGLLIDASGNAAIGHTSAVSSSTLTLNGNQSALAFSRNTGTDTTWTFSADASTMYLSDDGNVTYNMTWTNDGKVGIGATVTAPDGTLHVATGSAGSVTANVDFDDLVVENSTNMGMSFLSPNDTFQQIGFGDPDDNDIGKLVYQHTNDSMQFVTAGSEAARFLSNGHFMIGDDVDVGYQLHVRQNDASRGDIARFENNTNGGDARVLISAQANESGDPYLYFDAGGTDFSIGELWASGDNKMTIGKAIPSAFGAGDGIVINQVGKVGIGTVSPESTLVVAHDSTASAINAVFRSNEATSSQRAGGGFASTGNATASSRYANMWLDPDGANFGGSDYFYIQKDGDGGDVRVIQQSVSNLDFQTAGTLRMRIASAGLLMIGDTFERSGSLSAVTRLQVTGDESVMGIKNTSATDASLRAMIVFTSNDNVQNGYIATSNAATLFSTSSDISLKTDFEPIHDATSRVMDLNPTQFKWLVNGETSEGFVAQEVARDEQLAKDVVVGEDGSMGMDYGRITPLLTAALQDALKRIDDLESEIKFMKEAN